MTSDTKMVFRTVCCSTVTTTDIIGQRDLATAPGLVPGIRVHHGVLAHHSDTIHPGTVGTVGTVGMDGDGIPRGTPTDGMRITTVLSMDGDPIRITVILCMDSGDVVTGSIAPITMSYTITEPLRDSLRIVSV